MSATAPELPELPANAFAKADPSPDTAFYRQPRFVAHIDPGAIAAVTRLYREVLPPGGVLLDLMGSWISHLPDEVSYAEVIGHGMNADELAANPRLDPAIPPPSAPRDAAGQASCGASSCGRRTTTGTTSAVARGPGTAGGAAATGGRWDSSAPAIMCEATHW